MCMQLRSEHARKSELLNTSNVALYFFMDIEIYVDLDINLISMNTVLCKGILKS